MSNPCYRFTTIFLFVVVSFFLVALPVSAKELVVTNKGLVIHQNQSAENVFVFGHDATIDGKVNNVIVVNGDLKINDTATVKDLVLVLGGSITQAKGAKVTNNILVFHWGNKMVNMLLVSGTTLVTSEVLKLVFSTLIVIVAFLLSLALRKKLKMNRQYRSLMNWKIILIGVATSIVLLAITLILLVTVIGIPFALLLLVPIAYFFFETLSTLSLDIGEKLLSPNASPWLIAIIGSAIVVSTFNFPLFGFFLFLCIFWLAMGIMVLRIWNKLPRRVGNSKTDS